MSFMDTAISTLLNVREDFNGGLPPAEAKVSLGDDNGVEYTLLVKNNRTRLEAVTTRPSGENE